MTFLGAEREGVLPETFAGSEGLTGRAVLRDGVFGLCPGVLCGAEEAGLAARFADALEGAFAEDGRGVLADLCASVRDVRCGFKEAVRDVASGSCFAGFSVSFNG